MKWGTLNHGKVSVECQTCTSRAAVHESEREGEARAVACVYSLCGNKNPIFNNSPSFTSAIICEKTQFSRFYGAVGSAQVS